MMECLPRPRGREARRAHRTAKLFDRHSPRWYRRVDPRSLDLTSWECCILGQTYGLRYRGGVVNSGRVPNALLRRITLGGHRRALNLTFRQCASDESRRLCAAWRYEIDVRRRTDRMRDALAVMNAEMAGGGVTDFNVTLTR